MTRSREAGSASAATGTRCTAATSRRVGGVDRARLVPPAQHRGDDEARRRQPQRRAGSATTCTPAGSRPVSSWASRSAVCAGPPSPGSAAPAREGRLARRACASSGPARSAARPGRRRRRRAGSAPTASRPPEAGGRNRDSCSGRTRGRRRGQRLEPARARLTAPPPGACARAPAAPRGRRRRRAAVNATVPSPRTSTVTGGPGEPVQASSAPRVVADGGVARAGLGQDLRPAVGRVPGEHAEHPHPVAVGRRAPAAAPASPPRRARTTRPRR